MGVAEIIGILLGATRLATTAAGIIEQMGRENRDKPTTGEIAKLKAEQQVAEEGWAAQLARLRAQDD